MGGLLGKLSFIRDRVNPVVGRMYRVADRVASNFGVEISFPVASPESDPRALWIDATRQLAIADAVFAVFDGESEAMPLEAAVARQMNIRLLVAAMDANGSDIFTQAGFEAIDARRGEPVVAQAIARLLGEQPGGSDIGPPGGAPIVPTPPPLIPVHH
jgi:hypothetical protein